MPACPSVASVRTKIAASAFLLLLVTACGSDADTEAASEVGTPSADASDATSDEGEPEESPTEAEAGPAAAKRALRKAVKTMKYEEVTGFESQVLVNGDTFVETTGVAVLSGWEATSVFTRPREKSYVMDAKSTGGTVWMQMRAWEGDSEGCWLATGFSEYPLGMLAMKPDVPVYFSLLFGLRTSGFANEAGSVMVGDLNAGAAINLLLGEVVLQLDLTGVQDSDRVPVEIGYDGSRVTSVAMEGADVLAMIERVSGPVPLKARVTLQIMDTTVAYPSPEKEKPVTVSAPPADLVLTADELKSGCR